MSAGFASCANRLELSELNKLPLLSDDDEETGDLVIDDLRLSSSNLGRTLCTSTLTRRLRLLGVILLGRYLSFLWLSASG